jgi:hypothetical protein
MWSSLSQPDVDPTPPGKKDVDLTQILTKLKVYCEPKLLSNLTPTTQ